MYTLKLLMAITERISNSKNFTKYQHFHEFKHLQ